MKLQEYLPSGALQPFIKSYRIIDSETFVVNRVIPSTSVTMAFHLKGHVSFMDGEDQVALPKASLSGLRSAVRLIRYEPVSAVLVVLFKAAAVPAFFPQPVNELFEQSIALDNFLPASEVSGLEERLAEAGSDELRIAVIEQFLLAKLQWQKGDAIVREAVRRIQACAGQVKINALARHLYVSQDVLEKRFRKITGSSPKHFASIIKLETIIHTNKRHRALAPVALDAGYFDQAHFNRDFKRFTGQTPGTFFKAPLFW